MDRTLDGNVSFLVINVLTCYSKSFVFNASKIAAILLYSTIVSRVSAHGRSTITPRFSVYWALTRDTGCLPCVEIEIGGADCVGVATTKRVRMEHGMHAGSSSI